MRRGIPDGQQHEGLLLCALRVRGKAQAAEQAQAVCPDVQDVRQGVYDGAPVSGVLLPQLLHALAARFGPCAAQGT
jgi:hypothetical protein